MLLLATNNCRSEILHSDPAPAMDIYAGIESPIFSYSDTGSATVNVLINLYTSLTYLLSAKEGLQVNLISPEQKRWADGDLAWITQLNNQLSADVHTSSPDQNKIMEDNQNINIATQEDNANKSGLSSLSSMVANDQQGMTTSVQNTNQQDGTFASAWASLFQSIFVL